jgi:hypothetical protein
MAMKFKEYRLKGEPNYHTALSAYVSSAGHVKKLPAGMLLHVASFIADTRLYSSERAQCFRDV